MGFLNSFVPSMSVTYWNPFSIRLVASLMLFAVLQWYWSFSSVSRSWVYLSVVLRSLCPKSFFTCNRSLVLWYSVVANQCLKSYSLIVLIVGSLSFFASLFLSMRYLSLMVCDFVENILSFRFRSFLLMYAFSIFVVFVFSFNVLPTQCFALVMVTVPFSRSMSLVFSHVSSIGLVPKSFDIERNSAILVLA